MASLSTLQLLFSRRIDSNQDVNVGIHHYKLGVSN
jgi:hypothetical protein